jgi:hypothetical protein
VAAAALVVGEVPLVRTLWVRQEIT